VDGTIRFVKVSGFPEAPKELSRDEAVVVPDQYVRLGPLRADDPPFLVTLFCTTGQLTKVSFRYKDGDATKTSKYLVNRDPSSHIVRIVREVFWGMDAIELKRFAIRCGLIGFAALVVVGLLLWFYRKRVSRLINTWWNRVTVALVGVEQPKPREGEP